MADDGKTVSIKARVTPEQLARLQTAADARFGGNLSAALRQALTDAELLRLAREDFRRLAMEHGLRLPRPDEGGLSTPLEGILTLPEWREPL